MEGLRVAYISYHYEGRRVSLAALAQALRARGVKGGSKSSLSRVLSGKREPNYRLLRGIAEARGMTLEEVVRMIEQLRVQYAGLHSGPTPQNSI